MDKYVYTFEELGLDSNNGINIMCVGTKGFRGHSNEALLCIIQNKTAHLYSYSTGRIREEENVWHWQENIPNNDSIYWIAIDKANMSTKTFALVYGGNGYLSNFGCALITLAPNEQSILINQYQIDNYGMGDSITQCCFSSNDNYIIVGEIGFGRHGWDDRAGTYQRSVIIKISHNSGYYAFELAHYMSLEAGITMLPNEEKVLLKGKLYSVNYDASLHEITLTQDSETDYLDIGKYSHSGFSVDGKYLWVGVKTTSSSQINIYRVDWSTNTKWTPIQIISLFEVSGLQVKQDMSLIIGDPSSTWNIATKSNSQEIIAVVYKDKLFVLDNTSQEYGS